MALDEVITFTTEEFCSPALC